MRAHPTQTSEAKRFHESTPSNKLSPREANKITIAMFIKLLATNIEASSFFGCVKRSIIISKDFDLVFFASSKSF